MANEYNKNLEIDRFPNKMGHYGPDNCRLVNSKINQNNKMNNRLIIINGVTKTLSEWVDKYGVNYKTTHARLSAGWSIERALNIE